MSPEDERYRYGYYNNTCLDMTCSSTASVWIWEWGFWFFWWIVYCWEMRKIFLRCFMSCVWSDRRCLSTNFSYWKKHRLYDSKQWYVLLLSQRKTNRKNACLDFFIKHNFFLCLDFSAYFNLGNSFNCSSLTSSSLSVANNVSTNHICAIYPRVLSKLISYIHA